MERLQRRRPYWREQEPDDEPETDETEEWQQAHRSFSDRVERFLMQLVTLGLVALALVQTLHTNTTTRRMLSLVESLEGVPWTQVAAWQSAGGATAQEPPAAAQLMAVDGAAAEPITLTVVSLTRRSVPQARLLVGGKAVGTFASGTVTAEVKAGQKVEVEAAAVPEALSFRVVGSPALVQPALGSTVTTRGDTQSLGTVQVARR